MSTLTITAGHGAGDSGATYHGVTERDLMTELRDIVSLKLLERGHFVRTDGDRGTNLPLSFALSLIKGSEISVELHTNAFTNPAAKGVEVVACPRRKALAQQLAGAIAGVLGSVVRGDLGWIDQSKTARGRLGFVRAGGLIVEVFFLSNAQELAAYQAKKWLVASAIADVLESSCKRS